ncbi:hypothetical protein, partial [Staphylococcus haemolyticus]|uniref:hypothetical protein n=1 Tax=Staphylococcus haemolyticus TaxID=1283 RepID=UPI003B9FD9F5
MTTVHEPVPQSGGVCPAGHTLTAEAPGPPVAPAARFPAVPMIKDALLVGLSYRSGWVDRV